MENTKNQFLELFRSKVFLVGNFLFDGAAPCAFVVTDPQEVNCVLSRYVPKT